MDPASAAVAFVGFAASLATLAGLVIESAKTINELCSSLKHAPNELKLFLSNLKQYALLLSMLKDLISDCTAEELPPLLKQFWLDNAIYMKRDYDMLSSLIKKLQRKLDGRTVSTKQLRARFLCFFRSGEIKELNSRLPDHIARFNIALSMINEIRSKRQSNSLSKVEDEAMQIQTGVGDIHEVVCRQEQQISGIRQHLRVVFDQVSQSSGTGQQRTYLERRFTGVQPYRRHPQNPSLSEILPPKLSWMAHEIYKLSLKRQFWFGLMHITKTTETTWRETLGKDYEFDMNTSPLRIQFSFLPPSWVSDMFIRITMKSNVTFNLDRIRVNQDPRLLHCLQYCDVEGLKVLLSEGRVQRTDVLVDPRCYETNAESLMMVVHRKSCEYWHANYVLQPGWAELYRFLYTELCIFTINLESPEKLLSDLLESQAYDKREICDLIISYGVDLSTVLNSGPCYGQSILLGMYSAGPRSFVHEFAYEHIGLEEYRRATTVNSWILRTIARADSRFREKLESEARDLGSEPLSEGSYQAIDFSIETQLKEMGQSRPRARHLYLTAICAGGAASELCNLFLHPESIPEMDVRKENGMWSRVYLDISAMCANRETFDCLLDAGVNFHGQEEKIWYNLSGTRKVHSHYNNLDTCHDIRAQMAQRLLTNRSPALSPRLITMIISSKSLSMTGLSAWLSRVPMPETRRRSLTTLHNDSIFDPQNNGPILAAAVKAHNLKAVQFLLQQGLGLEWENENGFTPIMISIIHSRSQDDRIARALIDGGADLRQPKSCGVSAYELVRRRLMHAKHHWQSDPSECRSSAPCCRLDIFPWYYCDVSAWGDHFDEMNKYKIMMDDALALRHISGGESDYSESQKVMHTDHSLYPKLSPQKYLDRLAFPSQGLNWIFRLPSGDSQHVPIPSYIRRIFSSQTLLIVFGYVACMTAHLSYDVFDSFLCVLNLPHGVIRVSSLLFVLLTSRWLYKMVLAYFQ